MRAAILVLLFAMQTAAPPPAYTVTKWTGDHDFLFEFRGAATAVMVPPANDVLSARQKLPFAWKFFGQPVDGYFVSDNGYITFDPAATTSVPRNTGLPDASAPANSIFAFWNDFRMEDGHGQQAGQRVHGHARHCAQPRARHLLDGTHRRAGQLRDVQLQLLAGTP